MKLDFAIFGVSAVIQQNGLFSLLSGGMAWVAAKSFPAKCNQLVLLGRFSFEPDECGKEYACRVKVSSPTGDLLSPDLSVILKPIIHSRNIKSGNTFVALYNYDGFHFQSEGVHTFEFSVEDVSLGSLTLEAITEGPV